MPDPLAAFYLSLEDSPGDAVTLQALADWYEEQGQSDNAACLRWSVRRRLFPFRCQREVLAVSSPALREGWYWWAREDPYVGNNWGHPVSCRLPESIWKLLRHSLEHAPAVFKDYKTLREAYEELFEAWPRVLPLEREKRS